MYQIKFYKTERLIGEEKHPLLEKAETSVENSDYYSKCDYYEIIDLTNGEIVKETEIMDPDDVLSDMFDDENSKEGFDWTLED